jgi:hypothetical protein
MDNNKLEKNILDLKYQFQMQKIHASLTMLTVGIISFIGTFIWYFERLAFGIALSIIIILISLFYYGKAKRQLMGIVKDIRKLST